MVVLSSKTDSTPCVIWLTLTASVQRAINDAKAPSAQQTLNNTEHLRMIPPDVHLHHNICVTTSSVQWFRTLALASALLRKFRCSA
jgi:hypothetical protein